jgi:hypothetical protein
MTRAEAEAWCAGTSYPRPIVQVTSMVAADRIRQQGFELAFHAGGRVWGNGIYAATDRATEQHYLRLLGDRGTSLELRVSVRHILRARISTQDPARPLHQLLAHLPAGLRRFLEAMMLLRDRPAALTHILTEEGYDALEIVADRFTRAIGGNQLVVFDPHSVVVVNDEDSDPPRVMTTDELEEAALVNEALAFGAPSVEADSFMCRHFIPSGFPHCAAYPDGIPWEIQAGEVDHRQPWAGDHGIRYEPLTSEEFHARAAELRAAAARLRRRGAAD